MESLVIGRSKHLLCPLWLMLVVAAATADWSLQAHAESGWDVFHEAIKVRNKRQYEVAIKILKTIPPKFTRDRHLCANAERQIADVYMKMKRYVDAEKQYRHVVKEYIDQKSVAVIAAHALPNCLRYQKRLDAAVLAAREFRKTFSAHRTRMAYSLWLESSSLLKLKKYRAAEEVVNRLAEEYPDQLKEVANALVEFARRMRKRGLRSKQRRAIEKLVETFPDAIDKNVQKAYAERARLLDPRRFKEQIEDSGAKCLIIAVLRGASQKEILQAQEVLVQSLERTGNNEDLQVASTVLFNLSPAINRYMFQYPLEKLLQASRKLPDGEQHFRGFVRFHLDANSKPTAASPLVQPPSLVRIDYGDKSRVGQLLTAASAKASTRQKGLLALLQNDPKRAARFFGRAFREGDYANLKDAVYELGLSIDALRGGRSGETLAASLLWYGPTGADGKAGTADDAPEWLTESVYPARTK